MFVIIPILCFGLLFLTICQLSNKLKGTFSWRRSFLLSSVIWGTVLTAITEFLSLFNAFTFGWVLACWLFACLLICVAYLRIVRSSIPFSALKRLPRMPPFLLILLSGIAAITALVGVLALVAPPNTWDSMTYHMARVMHWIQDGSVAYYPTNIIRQLHQPPWAEYAILHLQLLSGGDHFANGVQWFSMVGSIIGASLIAQQFGADLRGQVFASVVTATLPMGILEASGTQNDYVMTFWLVCCVSFLLAYRAQPNWLDTLGAGASLGLALLTKGPAYLYALPLLALFCFWGIRSLRWSIWKPALSIGLLAGAINMAFLTRNLLLFGQPLGPRDVTALYTNDSFSPSTLASNLVRNLALQIGTPSSRVDNFLTARFTDLLNLLGINPSDPHTTWTSWFGPSPFQIPGGQGTWAHEAYAANPLQFLLILLVIGLFLIWSKLRKERFILIYIATLIGGFLICCLYLKWQPFNNRLLLALYVLFAPLCGLALSKLPKVKLTNIIVGVLLLSALPWLLDNQSRPFIGSQNVLTHSRLDQYFVTWPDVEPAYLGAAQFVRSTGCSNIGFAIIGPDGPFGPDAWEYPLWVVLNPSGRQGPHIEQINITNSSAPLAQEAPFSTFHPCAIVAAGFTSQESATLEHQGNVFTRAWASGPADWLYVDVFLPANTQGSTNRLQTSPTHPSGSAGSLARIEPNTTLEQAQALRSQEATPWHQPIPLVPLWFLLLYRTVAIARMKL